MSKQQVAQKYIFKIHTDRLKKARWKLTLTLAEARDNDEIISIGDSQMLRWIDELNGVTGSEEKVKKIRSEIRALRKRENNMYNRRHIRDLYAELDSVQFKPDYMHLVVDRNKDYLRACNGFTINGVEYVRLLGTSGGVKNNTIVFVSKRLAPILRERIDNGRNKEVPLVPAKLEAYRALTCSGSTPVSMPKGVLVVPDCMTHFKEDVLYLTDENDGEPELSAWDGYDVELNASDGCGMILPDLARKWSEELRLGYTAGAFNTRQSWEKGVVFAFDFIEFAEKVAGGFMVKDAWGHDIDIRDVELVLTTSMLKLWSSYDSIEQYLACCEENHYTFGVAKTAPKELEDRRAANYQFLQILKMSDEQIDRLIMPTVNEIIDVVEGDYRKALLFMAGTRLDDQSAMMQPGYVKAMMINPAMYNDPLVKHKIVHAINRRIEEAKIGVINLHANYSIIGGDLFALCQSIFGMEVTGILGAGELYNRYWYNSGAGEVACFRAPMSTAENVKVLRVSSDESVAHWFQYSPTCTFVNCWDTCTAAWNGCDFDGDILYITDNPVVLETAPRLKTLYCAQKSAQKKVPTEEDLIQSNIDGFGNDVGKVTNRITSMYDVQAQFEPGSPEYETLAYRIRSGQQYQQNSIDKTKGIICKPMPKYWYDHRAMGKPDPDDEAAVMAYEFNRRIVANKKPYFMRYIYPALMKEYQTFLLNTDKKSLLEFGITLNELMAMPDDKLSERQREFKRYYNIMMPVGMSDCTMNRICRRVEEKIGEMKKVFPYHEFDYSILRSDKEYTPDQYYAINRLVKLHHAKFQELAIRHATRLLSKDAYFDYRSSMIHRFVRESEALCSNHEQLANIILDICYNREGTKQFAWDVVPSAIVRNLLVRNDGKLMYPRLDPDGDIEYSGETYSMQEIEVDVNGDNFE